MIFADRLTIGQRRRTKEGYLAVRARAARAGVYDYLGKEVDPEGNHFAADQIVKVYRPEDEVFAKDSVHSFMLKPITDDHPKNPVTAANWQDVAKGVNAGAMRDGEYLAFDLVFMDKGLIQAIDGGKRELSNGYASEIEFADGETDQGEHYDAVMRHIRGNHVAVVDKGRAGPMCRIADEVICDSATVDLIERLLGDERTYNEKNQRHTKAQPTSRDSRENFTMHTLIIDGLQVTEVSDQAKAAIEKLQGQVTAVTEAKDKAEAKVGELTATVSTKDGEIAALEQKVKDAEVSPAALEKMVADRAALIAQAKAIHADVVTEGKTEAEIRKAVVNAKLGDSAKDLDDAAIGGAFAVLAKDAKPIDPVRNAMSGGVVTNNDAAGDYSKAMDERRAALRDAWKGAPAKVD